MTGEDKKIAAGAIDYTVVVPVFCEAPNLAELCDRLASVFRGMGKDGRFEILFVDDGSTDHSKELLAKLAQERPYVRSVGFRTNHGKSMALMAGFYRSQGHCVITIDGDLQNNPEDIPALVKKLDEGYDIVSGWRAKRRASLVRSWGSRLFNFTVAKMTGLHIHDFNCGFKIYRREVLDKLVVFGQFHRFIPLLAFIQGYKISEVVVVDSRRKFGRSKYPAIRSEGLLDLFTILFTTRFAFSPLHFFGAISLAAIIPSGAVIVYLIGRQILSWFGCAGMVMNRPLLTLAAVGFAIGINIFLTGFVCDFILYHFVRPNLRHIIDQLVDEKRS